MLKMLKNVNSDFKIFKIFKIFKTSKKLCHHYWVILVRMRPHAALKAQVLARQLGIPCVATVTLTGPGVIQATCHGSDRPLLHIKTTWLYFYCKRLCMKSEIVDDLAWSGSFKWNFCHWSRKGFLQGALCSARAVGGDTGRSFNSRFSIILLFH